MRQERKYKGKVTMDPYRGFHSPYVYCDAAEAIPVGDIKAPLQRVVDADGISVPPIQTGIEYENCVEYHQLSSIIDSGPIEFDVSSSGQNYLNFANTQLLVKAKITRGNRDDITDADHVGGVNLFLHSLFQQVDVSLNDVHVSQSAGTYAY